jgi:hypothetical protein
VSFTDVSAAGGTYYTALAAASGTLSGSQVVVQGHVYLLNSAAFSGLSGGDKSTYFPGGVLPVSSETVRSLAYADTFGAVAATAIQTINGTITGPAATVGASDVGAVAKATATAKGDLLAATGSAVFARLAVGSDGQVLFADSTQTTGVKWAPPAPAGSATGDLGGTYPAPTVTATHLSAPLPIAQGGTASASASAALTALGATPTATPRSVSGTGVTAVAWDVIEADATSAPITVTLPTNTAGVTVFVKKMDSTANAVTITGTIDGVTNPTLTNQYQTISLVADGTKWVNTARPDISVIPAATNVQTFTTSGTWTKPTGAVSVTVLLIGGGGGGGSGRQGASGTVCCGGGGGVGGAIFRYDFPASVLPSTVSITVGSGGGGGTAQATADTNGVGGGSGGATIFGSFGRAGATGGGSGGTATTGSGGTGSNGTTGGGGGASASTTGGVGGASSSNTAATGGGAGGGVTTTPAASNGGSGGTSMLFANGNGGVVGSTAPTSGGGATAGVATCGSGGGGGASSITTTGQAGATGALYGGGGGGGGASLDGFASGGGGTGAAGIALIVTYF